MKTILVPTDFSECAEYALKHATYLARKTKAKIILLHVVAFGRNLSEASLDGEWMGGWAGEKNSIEAPLIMRLLKGTKRKMAKLMAQSFFAKIDVKDMIAMGDISQMIIEAAKKNKVDMIVMGTRGARGLNDVFVGSNAEKVVRYAEVPVITIQNGKGRMQLKNIVFATDFSEETKYVFPFVRSFSEMFGAKLQLVKIIGDSSFKVRTQAKKEGESFLKENNLGKFPISILHDLRSKAEGISRFAEMHDADLIALGTHGRHGLAHFLRGSIAEDVVNYAFLPVLTVNFHKKLLQKTAGEPVKKKVKPESEIVYQIPSI